MRRLTLSMLLMAGSFSAQAACVCTCSAGQVVPLCQSSLDIPPICPPRVCPIAPVSIEPIGAPMLPPLGTNTCRPVQVLNPYTGTYQWQTVCR